MGASWGRCKHGNFPKRTACFPSSPSSLATVSSLPPPPSNSLRSFQFFFIQTQGGNVTSQLFELGSIRFLSSLFFPFFFLLMLIIHCSFGPLSVAICVWSWISSYLRSYRGFGRESHDILFLKQVGTKNRLDSIRKELERFYLDIPCMNIADTVLIKC